MDIREIAKFDITKDSGDYILRYLTEIGVSPEDAISMVQGPFENDFDDWRTLKNMEKAVRTFKNLADRNKKGFIVVDSDVDGFTSAAEFYMYAKKRYPDLNLSWWLHRGKEHGVELPFVPEDADFVIIPDAGSSQKEELTELSEKGKTVIVLDHHHMDEELDIENIIIVNNQLGDFRNRDLSGAGVVFLFLKAFDDLYYPDNKIYENFIDLAALGIISDMMKVDTRGNNYIITKGLKSIRNRMFQQLLLKQEYSISNISNPTKIDVAFYITPLINGLIRSGEQSEKEIFFRALISENSEETIETSYRGVDREETLYEYAARIAGNAKSRQDSAKKKSFIYLKEKVEREKLNENKLIAICLNTKELTKVPQNITGLAAMEILNEYNRPTLILREDDRTGLFSGSGRSKEWGAMPSLLEEIKNSGLSEMVAGHNNAFGCSFSSNNLNTFVQQVNEKLQEINLDSVSVDVYYYFKDNNKINQVILKEFAESGRIYGQGVPQPKFAFSSVIDRNDITFCGKDKNTLKVKMNGTDFIKFKADAVKEDLESIKTQFIKTTIVGRPQINEFNGRVSVQIAVDFMELLPEERFGGIRKKLTDLF